MAQVPASIRYKNPGAMWGGNTISRKWGELGNVALADGTGQGNHIAVFPSFVNGIAAQIDLWRTARYRNKTFAAAITIWSGGNNVASYLNLVHKLTPQIDENTIINDTLLGSSLGIKFLKAQAWHEAGRQYPASDADWLRGQQLAFAGKPSKVANNPQPKVASGGVGGGGGSTVIAVQQAHDSGAPLWVVLLILAIGCGISLFAAWWFFFRHKEIKTGGGQVLVEDDSIPGEQ